MKVYIFRYVGPGQFKVARVDDELEKGHRFKEYLVTVNKKSEWACDCKGFQYTHGCKHVSFVRSDLKSKHSIIDFEHIGDYESLINSVKKEDSR